MTARHERRDLILRVRWALTGATLLLFVWLHWPALFGFLFYAFASGYRRFRQLPFDVLMALADWCALFLIFRLKSLYENGTNSFFLLGGAAFFLMVNSYMFTKEIFVDSGLDPFIPLVSWNGEVNVWLFNAASMCITAVLILLWPRPLLRRSA